MAKRNRLFIFAAVIALMVVFSSGQAAAGDCADLCIGFSADFPDTVMNDILSNCTQGRPNRSVNVGGKKIDCDDIYNDAYKSKLEALVDYDYCLTECEKLAQ